MYSKIYNKKNFNDSIPKVAKNKSLPFFRYAVINFFLVEVISVNLSLTRKLQWLWMTLT